MNTLLLVSSLIVAGPIDDWTWTLYTSEAGRFSAEFPAPPNESSNDIDTAIGQIKYHSIMSETRGGSIAMGVSYNDYPNDIVNQPAKNLLDGGRDGAAENLKGKVVAETDFSFEGNPGREFTVVAGEGEGRLFYHTRVFIVGTRMYQLQVVRVGDTPLDAEAVVHFFGSFKLTK